MSPRKPKRKTDGWTHALGFGRRHMMLYEHLPRGGVLMVRWWDAKAGEPRTRTLNDAAERAGHAPTLRDAQGKPLRGAALLARQEWAVAAATEIYQRVFGEGGTEGGALPESARESPAPAPGALTVAETERLSRTGKLAWPESTHHRRSTEGALRRLVAFVGPDTTWGQLTRTQFREWWRTEIRRIRQTGKSGFAGAVAGMRRVMFVAAWLRREGMIPADAAIFERWLEALKRDFEQLAKGPVPRAFQPRYTLEQSRALLAAAPRVDPRLHLVLVLGAEQRAGQVVRAYRSHLTLDGPEAAEHGVFQVPSRGKKVGATIELTTAERAVLDHYLAEGYLADLEALHRAGELADYALFPGKLQGYRGDHARAQAHRGPMHISRLRKLFYLAEDAAEVPHQAGRAFYGIRRIAVDAVTDLKISLDGLKAHGGWATITTPMQVYKDKDAVKGRREARDARARIRGEETPE